MRGGVDWRAGPGGDDRLWRMTLHAMEWLEALEDEPAFGLMADWPDANPPFTRDAAADAWTAYATSIRTVVWMQQIARRPKQPATAVIDNLAHQLRWLERRLETDIRGNHLIKNIKALIWAGRFFKGAEPQRWRRLGLRLLAQELPRQVLSDGCHYERSPSYHAQVFVDLMECRFALGADPFGGALDGALHRMAQAIADLAHPDGLAAQFNDAGLHMAYAPGACLRAYARLFGCPPRPRAVFAFPEAGYYGFRRGGTCFIADCGPIAPDALVAHGHGDVLSFEWSVGGRRLIVDQGVCQYAAGERRDAARSAVSHNTLCIEQADQADFFNAFRCGRRPRVEALRYAPTADGFLLEGTHDGFAHLRGRLRHVRRFEVSEQTVVLHDRLEGRPDRAASIGLLLHPDVVAREEGGAVLLTLGKVRVRVEASEPLAIEPAVWWPDLGVEHATHRLRLGLPCGVPAVTTWLTVV